MVLDDDRPIYGPRPANVAGMRAKAFVLLGETGLPDEDRHDLASFILGRRVRSWREFDADDWARILDALTGWHAVQHLRRERGLC